MKAQSIRFCPILPSPSTKEILRYCGAVHSDLTPPEDVINEALALVTPRLCYQSYPLAINGDTVLLGDLRVESKNLANHLIGFSHVVLLAATVGVGLDRMMAKYSSTSPSKALFIQALGAERVETLCDVFCNTLKEEHSSRFSPGYGDLSLDTQKTILEELDAGHTIGLYLTDHYLLTPSKSVTAFVGIRRKEAL